jgi:hypothetical protein
MQKLIISMALLVAIGGPAALAQTGGNTKPAGSPSSTSAPSAPSQPTIGEAPIGHRQPRASDVPPEQNLGDPNDPLSRENAALDKKIKSICRGC